MSTDTDVKIEGKIEGGSVEIKGVRMQATEQSNKPLKVGDRVRLLKKEYSDSFKAHTGIITHFDKFEALPSITVCYVEVDYSGAEIKFLTINEKSEHEVVSSDEADIQALPGIRKTAEQKLEKVIETKRQELEEAEHKLAWFQQYFGKYFADV